MAEAHVVQAGAVFAAARPPGKPDEKLCASSGNGALRLGSFRNDCSAFLVLGLCCNLV